MIVEKAQSAFMASSKLGFHYPLSYARHTRDRLIAYRERSTLRVDGPKMKPVVSVVVPAYNAAKTIGETLLSAAEQTFEDIEIIVVNDGSTDETPNVVRRYAAAEPRIRLLTQSNQGVAAARNLGISHALGEFVAPLDADDLWHPTKLQRELEIFRKFGGNVGFVYSGCRWISEAGEIIESNPLAPCEGKVFLQHYHRNFVGNGSGILARRSALVSVGGYDSRLRALGAEGCEDFLLQGMLAHSFEVMPVHEYLVGYRQGPDRMSSDVGRMERSDMIAREIFQSVHGPLPACLKRWDQASSLFFSCCNAIKRGNLLGATLLFSSALACAPIFCTGLAFNGIKIRTGRWLGRKRPTAPVLSFHDADPRKGCRTLPLAIRWRLARLKRMEHRHFSGEHRRPGVTENPFIRMMDD